MSGWTESDVLAHFDRLKQPDVIKTTATALPKREKYGNKFVSAEGQVFENRKEVLAYRMSGGAVFQSIREAEAYQKLLAMERCGHIVALQVQPRFALQDSFDTKWGKHVRPVYYIADFRYKEIATGETVVVDAKGFRPDAYRIKAKWFMAKYPDLRFEEW